MSTISVGVCLFPSYAVASTKMIVEVLPTGHMHMEVGLHG